MSCSGIVADDIVTCATGTFDALDWITYGGVIPGGMALIAVCDDDTIWAIAVAMSVPGWKYTLTSPTPYSDCDSMREMPLTVEDMFRSLRSTTRASMSLGNMPGYVQTTATTGMSMSGKMSTAIRCPESTAISISTKQATAIVYGLRSASRTIHIRRRPHGAHRPARRLVGKRWLFLRTPSQRIRASCVSAATAMAYRHNNSSA